ncbi:sterol-binding protein [Geobacillus sp. CAMR12739]|nr:sterol-binding protein [Geobacillus sp. CAMR12739]
MEMRELVGQFVERMQVLRHLVPILPDEQLYVRFESDDETALLLIGKESAARGVENDERKTLTVRGSKEALASLLNGELKLQQLVRLREVHVSGSFRQLLLLESLLHLAKPYRDVG